MPPNASKTTTCVRVLYGLCNSSCRPRVCFSGVSEDGRRRSFAVSNAVRCDDAYVDASARVKRHSKSQDGEDRYLVDTYFKGLCGGTYLELGALDGVRFSNSHLFEFGFGWSGVLIEPNPKSFKALQTNRPKNRLHNVAVCDVSREVHFMRGDEGAVTGIFEFMAPSFRAEWFKGSASARLEECPTKFDANRFGEFWGKMASARRNT